MTRGGHLPGKVTKYKKFVQQEMADVKKLNQKSLKRKEKKKKKKVLMMIKYKMITFWKVMCPIHLIRQSHQNLAKRKLLSKWLL